MLTKVVTEDDEIVEGESDEDSIRDYLARVWADYFNALKSAEVIAAALVLLGLLYYPLRLLSQIVAFPIVFIDGWKELRAKHKTWRMWISLAVNVVAMILIALAIFGPGSVPAGVSWIVFVALIVDGALIQPRQRR